VTRRIVFAILLLLPAAGLGATLAERLDEILDRPAARRGYWGLQITDLSNGRTLYQRNAGRLFVPASNMKLFTTAQALVRLGPDHRYITRLASTAPPDEQGRISGDLLLIGGGDPNLSARVLPYNGKTQFNSGHFAALEELADQAAALGIREVEGNVVGDDTWYPWQRYADSWDFRDLVNGDGAPVTALAVNDNTIYLRARPSSRIGEPAQLSFYPPSTFYTLENRTRTVSPNSARRPLLVRREPGDRTVYVSGEIGTPQSVILAIDDPALVAAQALREALERRSIRVLGQAVSRHLFPEDAEAVPLLPAEFVLASRSSLPLMEDLRLTNKISQNLHAEIALREVARQRRGIGSLAAGLAELDAFAREIGIAASDFIPKDGSGLSRQNLVSPAALTALLRFMWNSPHRPLWVDTLPIAGYDGSLYGRLRRSPLAEKVRAKTGTMTNVSALSGYLETASTTFAFAILVNNHGENSAPVRALMDEVLLAVWESAL
jgi:D-alanyl-D-alanine carboxypeptidase/D-alanyl-D-alanine-endopeptidase (penicillin-binding protein 4)